VTAIISCEVLDHLETSNIEDYLISCPAEDIEKREENA